MLPFRVPFQMKDLPYHQGLQFIRRLKNQKHPRENVKPWKKSRKTAEIVAHVSLSQNMYVALII